MLNFLLLPVFKISVVGLAFSRARAISSSRNLSGKHKRVPPAGAPANVRQYNALPCVRLPAIESAESSHLSQRTAVPVASLLKGRCDDDIKFLVRAK